LAKSAKNSRITGKKVCSQKISWHGLHCLLLWGVNEMEGFTAWTALYLLLGAYGVALVILLIGRWTTRRALLGHAETPPAPPALGGSDMVRTWWVQPIDAGGFLLMSLIFMAFGTTAVLMGGEKEGSITANALVVNIVMFGGFVGMVCAIVGGRARLATWLGLRWAQWWHLLWFGPLVVVSMWGVMGGLQVSGYLAWMEEYAGTPSMQESVELMKKSQDTVVVGLMAFSAAIVAPLAEEIIFRGYLYPVAKKWSGKWAAVIFSALWFSACHGNVPLVLPLFLLGIILALAYEKTGSIWAPIGIHFFFNSATVLIQLAIRAGWIPDAPAT
jgi:membrane protease YdiL (CAAX protease family)